MAVTETAENREIADGSSHDVHCVCVHHTPFDALQSVQKAEFHLGKPVAVYEMQKRIVKSSTSHPTTTYNTPQTGLRIVAVHQVGFQHVYIRKLSQI